MSSKSFNNISLCGPFANKEADASQGRLRMTKGSDPRPLYKDSCGRLSNAGTTRATNVVPTIVTSYCLHRGVHLAECPISQQTID